MAIKIEDIIFWIVIASIVAIALWLLSGSPPETNALISITIFVAVSELLLWKFYFNVEKKAEIGFTRVKGDLNILKSDMSYMKNEISILKEDVNNKFDEVNKRLDKIGSLIRKRR